MRGSFAAPAYLLTLSLLASSPRATSGAEPPEQVRPENAELALPQALWVPEIVSPFGVVVSGSPAASRAGVAMLEAGGNAVDAAVATALALGTAQIASSGIAGQTLILVHMADGRTIAIDGAGAAPRRINRAELQAMHDTGRFWGHKAAATPGSLAALAHALERYGTKTFAEVLQPAIEIAELGFRMSEAARVGVGLYRNKIVESPFLGHLLLRDYGDLWDPDHLYCLPDLACTFRRLADAGPADFYRGAIASLIEVDMVRNGGYIRRDDLARVQVVEREPVRGVYRGHEVLSFPFPGGGATVIEALHILDQFPPEKLTTHSVDRLHLLAEAVRLALADTLPGAKRLQPADHIARDRNHATMRAGLIRFDRALWPHEAGAEGKPWEGKDTTQVSVADAYGNVVSLTQSLGRYFGCGVVAPGLGFLHNSLLENFDLHNTTSSAYLLPGRPPFSNMAPTIVLRNGHPLLVLGSAGSGYIAAGIVSTIVNVIDGKMPLCEAVTTPRIVVGTPAAKVLVEIVEPISDQDADALVARGFETRLRVWFPPSVTDFAYFGDVNSILIDQQDGTIAGVGDPHRSGVARAATRLLSDPQPFLGDLPCWRELAAQPSNPRH